MIKKILLLFVVAVLMISCSSTKSVSNSVKPITKADKIVAHAKTYIGTSYRFGGITNRGMDCSGLVFVAFKKENIQLPRVSRNMAKNAKKISLKAVRKGDLLFFRTTNSKRRINHVGVVSYVNGGTIKFIHSTSSRGVIESHLSQKYWKNAFVKAAKVLK